MTPEEFRTAGHELIDWIADYRTSIPEQPVRAQVEPGQVLDGFSKTPPETTTDLADILKRMDQHVVPGITQVQHPMHFGWFPSNASLSSVLGDMASSGLGSLGISWESSPALTEVEQVMCDWMRQLVGLSESWHGTIHDTASTACLVAMLLAREKSTDYSEVRGGLQGEPYPLVVYTTEEAHSSVNKAALLAGYGQQLIRYIDMEPVTRSMRVDALEAQIEADLSAGLVPSVVVASVGSTGITAVDPVEGIVEVAKRHGLWVHVDAAMAGTAMLLPECRHLWLGVEGADSVSWNPHKWMGAILDCSLFYVRDTQHLIRTMSTNPTYLQSSVDGQVRQYRDWGIPLGRRFRSLKLWFQLELEGIDAIRARIRRDLENAQWFAEQVEQFADWHVVAPVNLQTVCIRHEPKNMDSAALDDHNRKWVAEINASGQAFMSPAKVGDKWLVRVSVGVESTTREHLNTLWQLIQSTVEKA